MSDLLEVLAQVPRRFHLPALPDDIAQARQLEPAVAVAFAIEAARRAVQAGRSPEPSLAPLFTSSLAVLIKRALAGEGGDRAFQALVLRKRTPEVDEYVGLSALQRQDCRVIRSTVDAVAHPGKLRYMPGSEVRDDLLVLHRLATCGAWEDLHAAAERLLGRLVTEDEAVQRLLRSLPDHPALARLRRARALASLDPVKRYEALRMLQGQAGGERHGASRGVASERSAEGALQEVAELLNARLAGAGNYRAVRNVLVPSGFPGSQQRAKSEWDAALLWNDDASDAEDVSLIVEAKASPEAAASDFPRLLRGLQRLGEAQGGQVYVFPCRGTHACLRGESLRRLRPQGMQLPEQVFYCCDAPAAAQPPILSGESRALLLSEPSSVKFGCKLFIGGMPDERELLPVWRDLQGTARLRTVLEQYETARAACEAMLHPKDLVDAFARAARNDQRG
jgi:hypothetical protein